MGYQAVGTAAESSIGGGGLLSAFNFSLGGLIGQFLGEEDDFLGSYENTWNIDSDWGTGNYFDITCLEEEELPD